MRKSFESTLRSRVARRLFLLFLVGSLVPAVGLAIVVYQQVSESLIELSEQRLQQNAKTIGMSLIRRLSWHGETLQPQAESRSNTLQPEANDPLDLLRHNNQFSSLEIVKLERLGPLSPAQISHLNKSKALLQLAPNGDAIMTIPFGNSLDYQQMRLDKSFVWEDKYSGESYCVLTLAGQPLYCSSGMAPPPREYWLHDAKKQHNSGSFAWKLGSEEHLASFWRVPLEANLAHEGLIIVVSEERKTALAVLTHFRIIFPAIGILGLALAAWLAISQIRRQMGPLEKLERHTRQLAHGNFSSRIEVEGDDEFSSLADSFNSMSDHLNHQFHLLNTLGELDRAILSATEIESVIRLLLQNTPTSVFCDQAGVLRFDEKGNISVWRIDARQQELQSAHIACDNTEAFPYREIDHQWFGLDLREPEAQNLAYFAEQGATHVLVFPAVTDNHLDSALLLAYRQFPQETEEIIRAGRSLADRLAAAATSISWGNKLYHQAHFDALTSLPNRTLLRDRFEQALLRAERENLAVALMLIDLDRFKDVNDSLGHAAGDALLVSCANKLKKIARHTDTVARLGGDEFIVLIPDLPRSGAINIVDRIANSLSIELAQPVDLGTGTGKISVPASIGIALSPDNGNDIEMLMQNADAAMYESKHDQLGSYRFYSDQMNIDIKSRFELLQDLRKAIDNKEFFLVYQPKIEAGTGRVVGAEALTRWQSPRLGLISPAIFIPLITEIGLECALGEWVIDTACAQMAAWDAEGLPPIPVSVNASPAQFRTNEIVAQVRSALSRNGLAVTRLELEILESTAINDSGDVNDTLRELREMQVGIALDDFGTGYSSLVYLTQLPANVLKIDRAFTIDLLRDERKQAIVGQIISLAKVLDFKVVAEGVEEEAQIRILTTMGCDIFQGFFFSKPLLPADFVEFHKRTAAGII